jgi:hypothetical protein
MDIGEVSTIKDRNKLSEIFLSLFFGLPAAILVLGFIYFWFGVANRYLIFLYDHDMGPVVPDTSPFSVETSGRYWMAALVASGIILVLYVGVNWVLGRLSRGYQPPSFWMVWLACSIPLLIGIPAITMTTNQPVMMSENAIQITIAAWIGLLLAFPPGRMAAERPGELLILAMAGVGLMFLMLTGSGLQGAFRLLQGGRIYGFVLVAGALVVGFAFLIVSTGLYFWRQKQLPASPTVFVAGLTVSYLVMPLVHHLSVGLFEGYFYISSSSNFFANSIAWQIVVWGLAAGAIVLVHGFWRLMASKIKRLKPDHHSGFSGSNGRGLGQT